MLQGQANKQQKNKNDNDDAVQPTQPALLPLFPTALSCNENDGESIDRDSQYSSSQKTKRMRTSFKHHQLRTMKSYFAINHNPDAKDLKQLAQKTGLTKRVLQVTLADTHILVHTFCDWTGKETSQSCESQIYCTVL